MEFMYNILLYSLFLLSFYTISVSSHLFSPIDNYLINCGSTAAATLVDNRPFAGDIAGKHLSSRAVSIRNENPFPGLPPIYGTARVFTSPFRYAFPIRDRGTHMVRLHFHAFDSSKLDLGRAQFHVLVDGHVVLSNFSRLMSGAERNPRILEYLIWVDAEKLVIVFVPGKDSKLAFVNAIEVISAPKDLVPDTAQFVSSENVESFDGLSKQALEVVYRVTVGGPKVTPFNDSLWRTWVPDDEFFRSSVGIEKLYFGGRIKYHSGGASREVGPDNVYNSARLIRSKNDSVPNVNMTWVFPIIGGYKYLVRLHFCDIASISLGLLYFNVYVNGYLAYKDLDLSYITNSLASPFYADFVVDGNSSVGALTVTVGPSKSSIPHVIDGILNGVEVMKLNNSHNSLDGEVCADFVLKSWSRGSTGVLLTLVAAVCIVLSLSIVIRRRMIGSRESLSWSRLPVNLSEDNVKIGNI
ncbi:probable receptor-like protein kinase At5g24010 [Gastrolobium bilobum]|uniref:probable receptor-like protein kinase At5g24010 n=1 Tax=Gastrolobium bilobum TaxID=150636 RepID=UPI002AAFBA02|nr:probable receptor-like protein kinase At5g24010 [Gastrolobium bilobum]